ncbi:MAG: hypothetical protein EBZ77_05020 [Chitinophagia bacterium]|nr:hypothetical protein [Chitinophagia bacterium]
MQQENRINNSAYISALFGVILMIATIASGIASLHHFKGLKTALIAAPIITGIGAATLIARAVVKDGERRIAQ